MYIQPWQSEETTRVFKKNVWKSCNRYPSRRAGAPGRVRRRATLPHRRAGGFGRGGPPPKPNSNFGGVQIGVITYSFRQGVAAKDLIPIMNKLGINGVELMSNHAEALAGAPAGPGSAAAEGGDAAR